MQQNRNNHLLNLHHLLLFSRLLNLPRNLPQNLPRNRQGKGVQITEWTIPMTVRVLDLVKSNRRNRLRNITIKWKRVWCRGSIRWLVVAVYKVEDHSLCNRPSRMG